MNQTLSQIKTDFYDKCSLQISAFMSEPESKEYNACRFKVNELSVVCRNAKITPKKIGQFVTFWKRNKEGITEPLSENDPFDFYVINVRNRDQLGQFVLPKSTLIDKGIISSSKKDGKRGFRVYPSWDTAMNPQARKTQSWQLDYFVLLDKNVDLKQVQNMYEKK